MGILVAVTFFVWLLVALLAFYCKARKGMLSLMKLQAHRDTPCLGVTLGH